ncbi:hypothetical protein T05_13266 [Trichinella murrelli]|uniref:Uncharacterized protein n=1 Tax=Trichinella murrelli TaxID=144512 RepID=A0A0V0UDY8_9BILA|nr:hypothetical protein T05_13266 [Trichinella murrelli]
MPRPSQSISPLFYVSNYSHPVTCFCVVSKGYRFIFTAALLNSCQRSIQPDDQFCLSKADYLHLQKCFRDTKDMKYLN